MTRLHYHAMTGALLFLGSGSALAHGGLGGGQFLAGFVHPLSGLDHLLAMVALGVYAAGRSGPPSWALPGGFVLAMVAGAALGVAGVAVPGVEAGIATSVLVLGLLLALLIRLPLGVALPLIALFALFHGHAHGTEMGSGALTAYAAGFTLATVVLHAAGYQIARWTPPSALGRRIQQALGVLIAAVGAVLLGA